MVFDHCYKWCLQANMGVQQSLQKHKIYEDKY